MYAATYWLDGDPAAILTEIFDKTASGNARQFGLGPRRIDHHMAELVRQGDEVALRIDDALLHPGGTLFEQPPQQMRLARARIALHQKARGEKLLDIELGRLSPLHRSHIDSDLQWRYPQFVC